MTPLFLVMCHWQLLSEVAGAPHVAGSFLFLLVSDALDVEGTGGGVCKMSEDPSETSFSLRLASVVTVADTDGAVEGILWSENGDGLSR